jgi:hypothetical protein
MSVNISAIAANYTGKIFLRFHVQSGTSHYFWMIDDIVIAESPTNDISAQSGYYGFTPVGTSGYEYTRIPVTHIQSADFSIFVDNIGTAAQTGTQLNVDINSGLFNASTPPITLPSLVRDTLQILNSWTPPATLGIDYTVTLDVTSDFADASPANNTVTFAPFQVSEHIIAIDDYSTTPGNGGRQSEPSGATEHEVGNFFEAAIDDIGVGIEFLAGSASTIGAAVVEAVLYRSDDATSRVFIAKSTSYTVVTADATTPRTLLLIDPSTGEAPILQKDVAYFMAIHSFDDNFQIATSGTGPAPNTIAAPHSNVYFPNAAAPTTTYGLSRTPMIRMNLDQSLVGVNEIERAIKFNVYPNPGKGEFNINLSSQDNNNVNLTVKNVVGQTVLTETVSVAGNTKHKISLTDYSKGIYFLTIDNETVKLIVE